MNYKIALLCALSFLTVSIQASVNRNTLGLLRKAYTKKDANIYCSKTNANGPKDPKKDPYLDGWTYLDGDQGKNAPVVKRFRTTFSLSGKNNTVSEICTRATRSKPTVTPKPKPKPTKTKPTVTPKPKVDTVLVAKAKRNLPNLIKKYPGLDYDELLSQLKVNPKSVNSLTKNALLQALKAAHDKEKSKPKKVSTQVAKEAVLDYLRHFEEILKTTPDAKPWTLNEILEAKKYKLDDDDDDEAYYEVMYTYLTQLSKLIKEHSSYTEEEDDDETAYEEWESESDDDDFQDAHDGSLALNIPKNKKSNSTVQLAKAAQAKSATKKNRLAQSSEQKKSPKKTRLAQRLTNKQQNVRA